MAVKKTAAKVPAQKAAPATEAQKSAPAKAPAKAPRALKSVPAGDPGATGTPAGGGLNEVRAQQRALKSVPAKAERTPEIAARSAKAAATREQSMASGETQLCAGACATVKPISSFPTTAPNKDGVIGRGKVCRACQRAARVPKSG